MKAGDLVRFVSTVDYPRYKNKAGLVMEERDINLFIVHIDGDVHPFLVHVSSLERIK